MSEASNEREDYQHERDSQVEQLSEGGAATDQPEIALNLSQENSASDDIDTKDVDTDLELDDAPRNQADRIQDGEEVEESALEEPSSTRKPLPLSFRRGGKRGRGGRWRGSLLNARPARQSTPMLDDNDLTDRQSPEKQDGDGLLSKRPGRQRAPHANTQVEVALRRQLELKVAYRAVVKALKPLLVELANRAGDELQMNKELYKTFPEYEHVLSELKERLDQRENLLAARLYEEEQRLDRIKQAKEESIRRTFEVRMLCYPWNII